ncbi:MAG: SixA phosphatase family protein [Jejuia sp.]
MKQIILVRHAKSSWEYDVIDHERPLKERGFNDAKLIANKLQSLNLTIDKVLISDAKRTTQTAEIILPAIKVPESVIEYSYNLYDFAGYDLTQVIKSCDNNIETLMIFGHNHAITAFANTFGEKYINNVPTCGVVVIDFQVSSWSEISNGQTTLTIFPRDLR